MRRLSALAATALLLSSSTVVHAAPPADDALLVPLTSDDIQDYGSSFFETDHGTYLVQAREALVRGPDGPVQCGAPVAGAGRGGARLPSVGSGSGLTFRCGGLTVTITRTEPAHTLPYGSQLYVKVGGGATLTVSDGRRTETMDGMWAAYRVPGH